jgi:hypothetical protein
VGGVSLAAPAIVERPLRVLPAWLGLPGGDRLRVSVASGQALFGLEGPDRLIGGPGADRLYGGTGPTRCVATGALTCSPAALAATI